MKLAKLVVRNLRRRVGRTTLTVLGVGFALALLVLVDSLSTGLGQALGAGDGARTLIVYRKNRFCPQTSILPEHYMARIERVDGVEAVLPVQVYLNNCRTSLDLVVFEGAPAAAALAQRDLEVVAGDAAAFERAQDGALVGRVFAAKRGLNPGDRYRFGAVDVRIAGVFESQDPTKENVVLTHLAYLQRAGDRIGSVTQFEVRVRAGADPAVVAEAIDGLFATAQDPTHTKPRAAHLASATADLVEILALGRLLALACVVVVLALVANTVWMGAQERVRELGVMRAVGFRGVHLFRLVLGEALSLSLLGAAMGVGGAFVVLALTHVSIGTEGVAVNLAIDPWIALRGAAAAAAAGVVAGVVPAVQAARRGIADALHS